jgi:hypothetical protein
MTTVELEPGIEIRVTIDAGVSVEPYAGYYDSTAPEGARGEYVEASLGIINEPDWHLVKVFDRNSFHQGYATLHASMFEPVQCEHRWGFPERTGEAVHNCGRGKGHPLPHRCAGSRCDSTDGK